MTPSARVQSAIELLDQIIRAAQAKGAPADRILGEWFRGNRFAGSKDRRAIRELVYRAIRACGSPPPSGRAAMLALARRDEALLPLFDWDVRPVFVQAVKAAMDECGRYGGPTRLPRLPLPEERLLELKRDLELARSA